MSKNVILFTLLAVIPYLPSCQQFQRDRDIEVVSITSEIDANDPGREMCKTSTLTKGNVETYFSVATEVDGHEFHHEAMILPCKYQGSIRIHGENLQWQIYAGGAGYLYNKASVNKRYLCKVKCCDRIPGLC